MQQTNGANMPDIELVNVNKHICQEINLKIEDGKLFVVVGTTGAGKTTLLNIIAGITDYTGNVLINGINADKLPPKKRGIGYLFQNLALFPHLTVEANIAYGLRVQGYDKKETDERVSFLANMMRMEHFRNRYPHMLSGGEKKRVALARSLAPSPEILLLDEPTSSLDHQTSKYLRNELQLILKKLGITTVYVTHDLTEAEEIADRIAFIHNGKIEQVSSPAELFFNPVNECVSEFIGMPNIIECQKSSVLASGLVEIISDDIRIVLPYEGNHIRKIAIPPHDIYISDLKPPGPSLNRYKGIIKDIKNFNSSMRVRVSIGKNNLLAELPKDTFDEMALEAGKEVYVVIKIRRLRYVDS
jgi:ABC-type Fe3+/spermidine/putrescine transport system ATPase subunit